MVVSKFFCLVGKERNNDGGFYDVNCIIIDYIENGVFGYYERRIRWNGLNYNIKNLDEFLGRFYW